MGLRDEMAVAMAAAWPDVVVRDTPTRVVLTWTADHFKPLADVVMALLREKADVDLFGYPLWWCAVDHMEEERSGCRIAGRNPRSRKGHESCGPRWLVDLREDGDG